MFSPLTSFATSVTLVASLYKLNGKRIPLALLHSLPGRTPLRHAGSEDQHCRNQ